MKILNCVYRILYGLFLIGAILTSIKTVSNVYRIGYFQLFDFLPVYGTKAYLQALSFGLGIYCWIFPDTCHCFRTPDHIPHEKTQT